MIHLHCCNANAKIKTLFFLASLTLWLNVEKYERVNSDCDKQRLFLWSLDTSTNANATAAAAVVVADAFAAVANVVCDME